MERLPGVAMEGQSHSLCVRWSLSLPLPAGCFLPPELRGSHPAGLMGLVQRTLKLCRERHPQDHLPTQLSKSLVPGAPSPLLLSRLAVGTHLALGHALKVWQCVPGFHQADFLECGFSQTPGTELNCF